MNKHERIKDLIFKYFHKSSMLEDKTKDEQETLVYQYINEAEATEKEHEKIKQELKELSSLQKRNNEIAKIIFGDWGFLKFKDLEGEYRQNKFKILHYDFDKLSKVGVEDERH